MVSVQLFRTIFYSILLLSDTLTGAFAITVTALHQLSFETYYPAAVELIVAYILTLFIIPLHFIFHRNRPTSVLSTLAVEIGFLSILFLLFMGGSAAIASDMNEIFCKLFDAAEYGECFFIYLTMGFGWLCCLLIAALIALAAIDKVSRVGNRREECQQNEEVSQDGSKRRGV